MIAGPRYQEQVFLTDKKETATKQQEKKKTKEEGEVLDANNVVHMWRRLEGEP